MTTTLRPDGPEQRGADGSRERGFTVYVNSRPVGTIRLAADQDFGPGYGRIAALEIDPADRGRGRGCAAALAAEEVLRGWGCGRVRVSVPADEAGGLRLAAALGYTERNRSMVKRLPADPPALPGGGTVRPLTEAEYPEWAERERRRYIGFWTGTGAPPDWAAARAAADHAALLAQGPATPGTALLVLTVEGGAVGWLWLRGAGPTGGTAPAWVFSVEVAPEHRGRGHGRTLMLAAERECLAAGAAELGLNVFAGNAPALALYSSLGYRPTTIHLHKALL